MRIEIIVDFELIQKLQGLGKIFAAFVGQVIGNLRSFFAQLDARFFLAIQ